MKWLVRVVGNEEFTAWVHDFEQRPLVGDYFRTEQYGDLRITRIIWLPLGLPTIMLAGMRVEMSGFPEGADKHEKPGGVFDALLNDWEAERTSGIHEWSSDFAEDEAKLAIEKEAWRQRWREALHAQNVMREYNEKWTEAARGGQQ